MKHSERYGVAVLRLTGTAGRALPLQPLLYFGSKQLVE
jgi:hypothetical protein